MTLLLGDIPERAEDHPAMLMEIRVEAATMRATGEHAWMIIEMVRGDVRDMAEVANPHATAPPHRGDRRHRGQTRSAAPAT